jgi:hypothetical protein
MADMDGALKEIAEMLTSLPMAPKPNAPPAEWEAFFTTQCGFLAVRKLPSGEWIGIKPFMFTWGLCRGLAAWGIGRRWCYKDGRFATIAMHIWDGEGDPPGPWIKAKGGPREYVNPHLFNVIGHNSDGGEISEPKAEQDIDGVALWKGRK